MNHTQILKRAWTILWGYKTLWVFGIILALTSASFNNGGNQSRYEFSSNDADNGGFHLTPPPEIAREFEALGERLNEFFSEENLSTLIGIIVGLVCLGLLLFTVFRIANYVSQVALIRMVDQYETSGEKVTWKQGFRLGWSRQAWQLFLVDLVIFLPLFVIVLVLIGCAALPLIASSVNGEQPAVFNIVTAIGISFMAIFLLIVIGLVLSLVMELIRRVCVLEERGAIEAIRQGYIQADPEKVAGSPRAKLLELVTRFAMLGQSLLYPEVFSPSFSVGGSAGLLLEGAGSGNTMAQVYETHTTIQLGNPLTQTTTIEISVRPIDLPADWVASVFPMQVTLLPGEQVTVTVSIVPGAPAPQGTTPSIAVEGYVGGVLLGGVTIDVVVPRYLLFDGMWRVYLPIIGQ